MLMNRKKKPSRLNCVICEELWKKDEISVKCSLCKKVIHGPSGRKNCSLLSIEDLSSIMNSGENHNWTCPNCTADEFPFYSLSDNDFRIQFLPHITNPNIFPDPNIRLFVDNCAKVISHDNEFSSDDLDNIYSDISSKYYDVHDMNRLKLNSNGALNLCHLNIASLSKHFDDLHQTLSSLKKKFDIIGVSEHKLHKHHLPILNSDLEGYRPFIFDSSVTSHGGTGFYISNTITYKKRDDLKLFSPGDFESTFIEVIAPNRKTWLLVVFTDIRQAKYQSLNLLIIILTPS